MSEAGKQILKLEQAGFNQEEINNWQAETRTKLETSGFTAQEADDYFGVKKEPKLDNVKNMFQANFEKNSTLKTEAVTTDANNLTSKGFPVQGEDEDPEVKEADTFVEALEAGWDMSVSGLVVQGKSPDVVLKENPEMAYRIASQVGTLAGDIPAMIAGAFTGGAAGGAVGSAVPVAGTALGTTLGAGAGAFALPEAMRQVLMEGYDNDDITSFGEFWEKSSAIFINSMKAGAVGAATVGVGGLVAKGLGTATGVLAKPVVKTSAQLMTEVATMTSVGAALEGHAPEPQDFLDAMVLLGGMKVGMKGASKLRKMYSKSGKTPAQVVEQIENNPAAKQKLLSENGKAEDVISMLDFEPIKKTTKAPEMIVASELGNKAVELSSTKGEATSKRLTQEGFTTEVNPFPQEGKNSYIATTLDSKGKEVGFAKFKILEDRKLYPDDISDGVAVFVAEGSRRKGIASNLYYQTSKKLGLNIENLGGQTGEGAKFREALKANTIQEKTSVVPLSPEAAIVMEKVRAKKGAPKVPLTKDGLVAKAKTAYTEVVSSLEPLNEAVKILSENPKDLPSHKNPHILARMVNDYKAKAKHFFEKGTLEFESRESKGKGLKQILEKAENINELEAYMINKRVLEKSKQGIGTGFDVKNAEAHIKKQSAKYEKIAQEVTNFSNEALKYVEDAGIISKASAKKMRQMNENYVPFKRLIETQEGAVKNKPGKNSSLKKMTGSELAIQNPLTSIVENTVELIKMAETNRPFKALIDLAKKSEGQTLIEKVEVPKQKVVLNEAEVSGLLKNAGLDPSIAEPLTTYRAMQKSLNANEFQVYEKGKRTVYRTTPELAKALNSLGGDITSSNMLFKLARGVTKFKRVGITFTPDFILRNFIRDKVTASVFSKSKNISVMEAVGAAGDIFKKNDVYYKWLKAGGANGAFLEMGDAYIKHNITKLQKKTNFMGSARNVMSKPIDLMRLGAELSEQSLRLAEFKKITKGDYSPAKLTEGGFASREITIDFQRRAGNAQISALNSINAFFNVGIQGLDRTIRAIGTDPVGVTTKGLAYITAPSVLLWYANKDDQRVQELPNWEKDLFWIIATNNWQDASAEEADGIPDYMKRLDKGKIQVNRGSIFRIPKPMELGLVFGSSVERVLTYFFTDHPEAFKDFGDSLMEMITPSIVPDIVSPVLEQYNNKSFFTGNDIIPHHMKDIMPQYQFVEYTSESAKTLGKMIATFNNTTQFASPLVLDNYIRSWSGSLGQYAVQLSDKTLKTLGVVPDIPEATPTLSDIPFIRAFAVRFPRAGTQSVQNFYDNYEASNRVLKTIKYLAKQQDFENMQKEMTLEENQDKLISLDNIKKALTNQSQNVKNINKNPEMSPDEKRQMIDGQYLMMIKTAKSGNDIVNQLKEELKNKDGDK